MGIMEKLNYFDLSDFKELIKMNDFFSGDEVKITLDSSTGTTPLFAAIAYLYNGFNGFRI